jgi:hypothetical protein
LGLCNTVMSPAHMFFPNLVLEVLHQNVVEVLWLSQIRTAGTMSIVIHRHHKMVPYSKGWLGVRPERQ